MRIGIVREIHPEERRVAASPAAAKRLIDQGFEVMIESGAGDNASYPDSAYQDVGVTVEKDTATVWSSDMVIKVRPPAELVGPAYRNSEHEVDLLKEGATLISFIFPAQNEELVERLKKKGVTTLAMDCVPRISRAQKLDALSSMANIAGYRAVVEAANEFGSFFTGQFTAAGKVPPAKVLVIGAGVAGLAAIAAAKGLGAIVRAFDTRAAVKDQVKSLGGEFLEVQFEESGEGKGGYAKVMSKEFIEAEMALFYEQAKEVDIVITTALIPGKRAPTLWPERHVKAMKPGSVVVDLAAEQGGNCAVTEPGKKVDVGGVKIIGFRDLPSRMANVASDLYGTNIAHLLDDMGKAEGYKVDMDDEVVRGSLVTHEGETTWPPPPAPEPEPKPAPEREIAPRVAESKAADKPAQAEPKSSPASAILSLLALALVGGWVYLRATAGTSTVSPTTVAFLQHLTVFVLACFVGWQLIWNVTPALHTPLMAVTNAISGIIIVGGLISAGAELTSASTLIAGAATLFATINVVGGFLVTQRMLKMFRK
jgi:NAD(P) transhydrogenase subunit alpha